VSSHVRATDTIIDDGVVHARAGDVAEVLHSHPQDDGVVALTVRFRGMSTATTVYLGVEVESLLALAVAPPVQEPAPMPLPSRRTSRTSHVYGFAAAAAAIALLAVWTPGVEETSSFAPQTTSEAAVPAFAVDVQQSFPSLHYSGRVPEKPLEGQRRVPCEQSHVVVNGGCFLLLKQKPPCLDGYEHDGQCIVPVAAPHRSPSTIDR
jgi:hypothetical protein